MTQNKVTGTVTIRIELPAHLQARDTTVQPHALETYDQLKDKYDASAAVSPAED